MIAFDLLKQTTWLDLHQMMQKRNTELQDISFARISLEKSNRQQRLRKTFSKRIVNKIFITNSHFKNIHIEPSLGLTEERLGLKEILEEGTASRIPELDGSIVLISNADIDSVERLNSFSNFYEIHSDTIFIGWDTDNHHTLHISMAFATLVDFYIQSQLEHFYDLSRINPLHTFLLIGCINIKREYAYNLLPKALSAQRSNEVQGLFANHNTFPWRNSVINALSNSHPHIGFFSDSRGATSNDKYPDRLIDYKVHWIAPVLNDVSGRVDDVLITGGIPIVPESLRFHPALIDIHPENIVYYNLNDIIDTEHIISCAIEKYDKCGKKGILSRFEYSIARHGDFSLSKIIKLASSYFKFNLE